jgi:L-fuconolactonase
LLYCAASASPELADLARAFPDTKIVLNHVGGPLGSGVYRGKRSEVFHRWAASIKALAAHQNVYVKLGGLGQIINGMGFNEQAEPPLSEILVTAWRPYIETCIEAFGADRSMFESNFPVDKVSYSYPIFWNACKLLTKGASNAEKTAVFSGTAARFYRLNAMG